jgi:hypothetical protein
VLDSNGNSLEIRGNLEFDGTWPTGSLFHQLARKNEFPTKMAPELEFLLKVEFGLICRWFEN